MLFASFLVLRVLKRAILAVMQHFKWISGIMQIFIICMDDYSYIQEVIMINCIVICTLLHSLGQYTI